MLFSYTISYMPETGIIYLQKRVTQYGFSWLDDYKGNSNIFSAMAGPVVFFKFQYRL